MGLKHPGRCMLPGHLVATRRSGVLNSPLHSKTGLEGWLVPGWVTFLVSR